MSINFDHLLIKIKSRRDLLKSRRDFLTPRRDFIKSRRDSLFMFDVSNSFAHFKSNYVCKKQIS